MSKRDVATLSKTLASSSSSLNFGNPITLNTILFMIFSTAFWVGASRKQKYIPIILM
jgi:hypothetical protein